MTQQQIDRDFDHRELKDRVLIGLMVALFLLVVAAFCATAVYAQEAPSAAISFTAPTTRTDGSTITGALTYEVWQGVKGAAKTRVGTISATNTTVTSGLAGGNEYCWHIVVREANRATPSAPSNEACKVFPVSGPNVVTITVV